MFTCFKSPAFFSRYSNLKVTSLIEFSKQSRIKTMPKVKFDSVVSFSTEDPAFPASNLLDDDPTKKWKCNSPGEKSTSVVLQLEKACVISNIDIGNEHSAYIEVLVSRSTGNDDYTTLLVMSSFMTPMEARQSQNVNKVRMFGSGDLSEPECKQKWNKVKIICTQPFNKRVQYGLSFVTLHSVDDRAATASPTVRLGKFVLRPESPRDTFSAGSIFAASKESEESPCKRPLTIREASLNPNLIAKPKTPIIKKPRISQEVKLDEELESRPRNRQSILYTDDDDKPQEKIDKLIEQKLLEDEEKKVQKQRDEKKKKAKAETTPKHDKSKDSEKEGSSNVKKKRKLDDVEASTSRRTKSPKKPKVSNKRPFSQLLQNVSVVISGIQNPDRANLRSMALAMGATYKGDWCDNSTHLICAFKNTPKFNQVKGLGKIVRKEWILECHKQRKRLPWRRFALDDDDREADESEEEISEKTENTPPQSPDITSNHGNSDTDEEIERIQVMRNRKNGAKKMESPITISETSDTPSPEYNTTNGLKGTPEKRQMQKIESIIPENNLAGSPIQQTSKADNLPNLPSYFEGKVFYIDTSLKELEKKLLVKYITAYNGNIVNDLTNSRIDIILTSIETVIDVKNKCSCDPSFVSSEWVWECHNYNKFVPLNDYTMC